MDFKILRRDALKATLYQCNSIPQILSLLKDTSSISDKSTALRAAGTIFLKKKWSQENERIFDLEKELRKNITQMRNRDIMNFIYFHRVCRETKEIKNKIEFTSTEFSKIIEIFSDRSMETTEIIALYYDLKRIKVQNLDKFMINKLNDENLSINITQLKIIMRTALNNTTFYNQLLIECCIKKILEIEFNLELNNVVWELIEILFEMNHRLIYCETKEIIEKITNFLRITELNTKDYLKILELHRNYNKSTAILRTTIEKFLQSCSSTSDPIILGYILNICPNDLTTHPLFSQKLIPACFEILENSKLISKTHIILLEGLLSNTHLLPIEFSNKLLEKSSKENIETLLNTSDILTKALILRFYLKKTNNLTSLSPVSFGKIYFDPLEKLLKFYTILKTSNLFIHLPGLESELINTIKTKINLSFFNAKLLITFISTQYNSNIIKALEPLISECLPLCLDKYDNEKPRFRALFTLYFNSSKWYEYADNYQKASKNGNTVAFLTDNHANINNIQGLIYLSKISKFKNPFTQASIIFLIMHPSTWTL